MSSVANRFRFVSFNMQQTEVATLSCYISIHEHKTHLRRFTHVEAIFSAYHNHHNHTYVSPDNGLKRLRTGNQWEDVTPGTSNPLLTEEKNVHITMVSGYGTFTVTRNERWRSAQGNWYQASAYTNLWATDGWNNDGVVFDQIEVFTDEFPAHEFGPGTPPLPTADPAQISSHPDD